MRMRAAIQVVTFGLLLVPGLASAKSWHGLVPGSSTQKDVVKKFGSPDVEEGPTEQFAKRIVYTGKSVSESRGAAEAQFWFNKQGVLQKIYVTPMVTLQRADVEAAWGKEYQESRTDEFRLYLHYAKLGFVVFFEPDNDTVFQLVYTEPQRGGTQAE